MSMLATLRSKKSANIDRLAKEIAKINNPQNETFNKDDATFWYPEVDKAGNGYAVFRWLPEPPVDGDDALPFVKYFHHGFMGPTGKWYIENSLTTLNQQDPVSELNSKLWKTGEERFKDIARKYKRKLAYVSNIKLITDQNNPEKEGNVFKYRYGKKIFDKINEAMHPAFPDVKPFNPFDIDDGANFKLKIRTIGSGNQRFRNYDLSAFDSISPLSTDEKELEKILLSEYSLKEFTEPSKFKSYDELKAKLDEVLGCDSKSDDVFKVVLNKAPEKTASAPKAARAARPTIAEDTPPWDGDGDDESNFFQKFADENA